MNWAIGVFYALAVLMFLVVWMTLKRLDQFFFELQALAARVNVLEHELKIERGDY